MIKIFHGFNEIPYKLHKFSGGEMHVSLDADTIKFTDELHLEAKITCSDDIMTLCLIVDALKRLRKRAPVLYLPYIPYARQDRVVNWGEPLSISVFCKIINSLGFDEVIVCDPHSSVATALIDNVSYARYSVVIQSKIIQGILLENNISPEKVLFIAPDMGASKKVAHLAHSFLNKIRYDYLNKKRNSGGSVESISCDLNHIFTCSVDDILIIDDICDGGATFLAASDALAVRFPDARLHLFVTHGIFSKGVDELFKKFKSISCTNSFSETYPIGVKVYGYDDY
jgi:ribose-phosphate pyrophosphokinase